MGSEILENNLHTGHRKRLREEFLKNGNLIDMPEHKLLELLLFYSIPRKDTNEIAHMLLNRFGSISNLLDASPYEIMKTKGIAESSVVLLKLIMPMARKYLEDKNTKINVNTSTDDVCEYLASLYLGFSEEVFGIITFNISGVMQGFDKLTEGDIASVNLSVRKLAEVIIARNAASVILAHNHPNGFALPSHEDLEATVKVKQFLTNMGVKLIDHIIVADGESVSLAKSIKYQDIFK